MSEPRMFRGRRKDNGKPIVGWHRECFAASTNFKELRPHISFVNKDGDSIEEIEVLSVTQSTGRHDKKGVEIFGGDRVMGKCIRQKHQMYNRFEGTVEWSEQYAAFQIKAKDSDGDLLCPMFDEVILAGLEVLPDDQEDKQ